MTKIYPIGCIRKIFGYNILPKIERNSPPKTQEDVYFFEQTLQPITLWPHLMHQVIWMASQVTMVAHGLGTL